MAGWSQILRASRYFASAAACSEFSNSLFPSSNTSSACFCASSETSRAQGRSARSGGASALANDASAKTAARTASAFVSTVGGARMAYLAERGRAPLALARREFRAVGIGAVDLAVTIVVGKVCALLGDQVRAVGIGAVGEAVAVVVPAVVAESFRTGAGHGT